MSRWHEKRPSENVINLAAALAGSLAAVASLALLSTRERRARVGLFKHGRELYIPSRSNTTAHSRHSGLIRLPCCALSSIRANHYRNEPPATASLSLPSSAPCGRSHCGDSDAGDADRIPRTNSTADLLANSTNSNSRPKHPEGPNIGPGSDDNWFQKGRCVRSTLRRCSGRAPRCMGSCTPPYIEFVACARLDNSGWTRLYFILMCA